MLGKQSFESREVTLTYHAHNRECERVELVQRQHSAAPDEQLQASLNDTPREWAE